MKASFSISRAFLGQVRSNSVLFRDFRLLVQEYEDLANGSCSLFAFPCRLERGLISGDSLGVFQIAFFLGLVSWLDLCDTVRNPGPLPLNRPPT